MLFECCVSDGGYWLRAEGWLRVKGYQPPSLPKIKKSLLCFLTKIQTHFRYFSLRIISFCIQNILFRFEAKHAKQTLFFAISLCSYSLPFRFVSLQSEIREHPTCVAAIIFLYLYSIQCDCWDCSSVLLCGCYHLFIFVF